MIENEQWAELGKMDGLRATQLSGHTLVGFMEGVNDFAPTFKVQRKPGLEYVDKRTGSYCDRILWKSCPACRGKLRQTMLASFEAVSTSDHKTVLAAFKLVAPGPAVPR